MREWLECIFTSIPSKISKVSVDQAHFLLKLYIHEEEGKMCVICVFVFIYVYICAC